MSQGWGRQGRNKATTMRHTRQTSRPVRLGAMAPARNRTSDAPTYMQVLTSFGFIPKTATATDAWSLWQRVAEDKKVFAMAQEIERPKHRTMTSITAGYLHLGQVLSTMTARQLNALKRRVGVPCAAR